MMQYYMMILNRDAFGTGADGKIDYELPETAAIKIEGSKNGNHIGTGLYKWHEHVENDYESLIKRDDGKYWGEDNPTEKITQRVIPEASARLLALETGEIDVMFGLSTDDIPFVKDNSDLLVQGGDGTGVRYWLFNGAKEGPWQDINFRLACTKAIDREKVVMAQTGGYGTPASSNFSPAQFGYTPTDVHVYDLEAAKEYLAKSNYNGETVVITHIASMANMTLSIMDSLKAIGVKVELKEENNSNMSPIIKELKYDGHTYNINLNPNADDIRRFLNTGFAKPAAQFMPSHDKVYELLDKALVAEGDARKELYAEVQKVLAEDCYIIPLFYIHNYEAINKNVEGFNYVPTSNYDLRQVKVAA